MGQLSKSSIVVFLLLCFVSSCCHGSRDVMRDFYAEQAVPAREFGSFLGFLPKGAPIPPSGPSKRHNPIGGGGGGGSDGDGDGDGDGGGSQRSP